MRAQGGLAAVDSQLELRADTSAALALLESMIKARPRDAEAWYRRGLITWQMARPRRRGGFIRDLADIRLLSLADSSLRRAAMLEPDSARYHLAVGRFALNSRVSTLRFAAMGDFERALTAARQAGPPDALAQALDEVGMVYWRRYDAVADRRSLRGLESADVNKYASEPRSMGVFLESQTVDLATEFSGRSDYLNAVDHFTRALEADPGNPQALRHAFMALAVRQRWEELRGVAQKRLGSAAWDPFAWLARGLADHRMRNESAATIAFDSALVLLSEEDRERYTRLSRILRGRATTKGDSADLADSARYAAVTPGARAELDRQYWMLSDPLALTPDNEHRLEFLSRVAYAEIVWTSDDLDLRGADTDRGDIHIRYGPPRIIASLAPQIGMNTIIWWYDDDLSFAFTSPPAFGSAQLADDFQERARNLRAAMPVLWTNVDRRLLVDSVRVQAVRFRGRGDSTDLFVVAELPVDSLVSALDIAQASVDVDFRVLGDGARIVARDSSRTLVRPGRAADDLPPLRTWRRSLPRGGHVYRVEALEVSGGRGARALGSVSAAPSAGFGVSDVLIADAIVQRDESKAAARWHDFTVTPNSGRIRAGRPVALLWEMYALGIRDGTNRYRVSLTLQPVRREGAIGFAARVIGGAQGAVGRSGRGREQVTLGYERVVQAAPAFAEQLTLDIGGAPVGRYRLTVEVTDLVTMQRAASTTSLVVERAKPAARRPPPAP